MSIVDLWILDYGNRDGEPGRGDDKHWNKAEIEERRRKLKRITLSPVIGVKHGQHGKQGWLGKRRQIDGVCARMMQIGKRSCQDAGIQG